MWEGEVISVILEVSYFRKCMMGTDVKYKQKITTEAQI